MAFRVRPLAIGAATPHRAGLAWSKGAVRVILTNPRYTGRQVWNRQR
jgi:site-specific DNA recombinase